MLILLLLIQKPSRSQRESEERAKQPRLIRARMTAILCVRMRVNSLYLFCSTHETQVKLTLDIPQRPLFLSKARAQLTQSHP